MSAQQLRAALDAYTNTPDSPFAEATTEEEALALRALAESVRDFLDAQDKPAPERIETQEWRPDTSPGRAGYLEYVRTRTVREVYDDLRAVVGEYPDGSEEYLSIMPDFRDSQTWPCPLGRIAVFAVNGSSEGDYVHVEVHEGERRMCVLLGKTFMGRDAAWAFARQVADLLGA